MTAHFHSTARVAASWFSRAVQRLLLPAILFVACVGTYATTRHVFDIGLMFLFGVFGYIMRRLGFTPLPMIMGFLLGPLLEDGMRRSLSLSGYELGIFFERPITLVFLVMSVLTAIAIIRHNLKRRAAGQPQGASPEGEQ
jgi:TctA family transporter